MAAARMSGMPQVSSAQLRDKVAVARSQAAKRYAGTPWSVNAQVPGAYLRKHFPIRTNTIGKLEESLAKGRISMRGFDRCLRLAWSNADLAGRNEPNQFDVAKAIFLRGPENLLEANSGASRG